MNFEARIFLISQGKFPQKAVCYGCQFTFTVAVPVAGAVNE